MSINRKSMGWKKLFLFCFGLFFAAAFAMKWIETDLVYNGDLISILGLELFYPKEKITGIFSGADPHIKQLLDYHLHYDYVFMAGCYPGIACLCMMAADKIHAKYVKVLLFALAFLQLAAWAFDLTENHFLLKWLKDPVIGDEFGFYHVVVYSKWIIALLGAVAALLTILVSWLKNKTGKQAL